MYLETLDMSFTLCLITCFVCLHVTYQHDLYIPGLSSSNYEMMGTLNLGVLLPVHLKSRGQLCGTRVRDLGLLQRMEAISFVIGKINDNPHILPNHSMGFIMYDDCYTDITALANSLHFARIHPACSADDEDWEDWGEDGEVGERSMPVQQCSESLRHVPVVGLLGSESSITTVEIAKMMTIYNIPQVT